MRCLVCGNSATNDRRGLCTLHYSRFNAAKRKLPESDRDAFEAELIERKMLLPPKPKGRRVEQDIFAEIAQRINTQRKTAGQRLDEEALEIASEISDQAKKAAAKLNKSSAKPKPRKAANS